MLQFNGNGSRRHSNARRRRCRTNQCWWRRRRPKRRWKISWTISSSRNAGIPRPSSRWSGRGFRCRARTSRNEIRRSAWVKNTRRTGRNQLNRSKRSPLFPWLASVDFTATIFRGGADGHGSSGPRRRRWCLQTEIAASAIRRGRRKTPRSGGLDDGNRRSASTF